MNFITGPVVYALGGLLLVTGVLAGVQSYRLKSEQADSAACKADRSNFAATQTGNLQKIEELSHRLAVLAEARKVEAQAAAKAISEVNKQATAADARSDALARQLDALYAQDAGAQAWGSTGVDAGVAAKLPGVDR